MGIKLSPTTAYAATNIAGTLMNSVFSFYYVNIYTKHFHVSTRWFNLAQALYMVWNAINDPLFGYIQDNWTCHLVKSRRHSVLYGAPIFALSFFIIWIPWGDYSSSTWLSGLQLVLVLCFYDTMFTFVLLATSAMFPEISRRPEDRLKMIRLGQIGSLIGSFSVMFTNALSNNLSNYSYFIFACAVNAILSWLCLSVTGLYSTTVYDTESGAIDASNNEDRRPESWLLQTKQIFGQRNFVVFVIVALLQLYHSTFLSNFAGIFCDELVSKKVLPDYLRSIYYGAIFVLPKLIVVLGTPVVSKYGYYVIIKTSFYLSIFLGILLLFFGPVPYMVLAFFLLDDLLVNGTFNIYNLCMADIVDEDTKTHQRQTPISSMIYGNSALVTKAAISLAPLFTVSFLNNYGYEDYLSGGTPGQGPGYLRSAMGQVAGATSIVISAVQIILWKFYTIRN